jgi:hypothetical protein
VLKNIRRIIKIMMCSLRKSNSDKDKEGRKDGWMEGRKEGVSISHNKVII